MASTPSRTILHVDMDAFYASVETLDSPALGGKPVVVGGLGPRGVVATANYEARRYGVHSAMPMARARRLCPQAAFIHPRMARYREISADVFAILRAFTPLVEGLSLDEAFLDVSSSLKLFGSGPEIGAEIRRRIARETGLAASVGVAHNKFLAKLASDAAKPDGLLLVERGRVREFLDPMPVDRLWGVGKRTSPRLRALGILTIGQLRRADPLLLGPVLGNRCEHFLALAHGKDDREVTAERPDKSVSHEITFDIDLNDNEELLAELQRQAEAVGRRLRSRHLMASTVMVKIRDPHFHTATRQRSMRACSSSTRTLYRMARALFMKWRRERPGTPVRLLGMGVSGLQDAEAGGDLAGDRIDDRAEQSLDATLDRINRRFGERRITHAQTLKRGKSRK